jgi:ABC-type Fe3+-hydroxamate transport system substrate-binding protein
MKSTLIAAAFATLALAPCANAQVKDGVVVVGETEAVVTVVSVDRKARTVTVQGPKGRIVTINVPPEAQNLDQVKKGSRFQVRYVESVAVAVTKGGVASASKDQTVRLAPKGATPGGVVVNTMQISGTVEALDRTRRTVALKGPKGNEMEFQVAPDAKLEGIQLGDLVTVVYAEALAMQMLPKEGAAAKSAKPK